MGCSWRTLIHALFDGKLRLVARSLFDRLRAKPARLIVQAENNLADLQQPGGRWQSQEAGASDVRLTVEALRALELAGFSENRTGAAG
jgi:hypothetical protein